eukprot:6474764-Amphidinium_carterae.1
MSTGRARCAGAGRGARRAECASCHRGFAWEARAAGAGTDACARAGRGCTACDRRATCDR